MIPHGLVLWEHLEARDLYRAEIAHLGGYLPKWIREIVEGKATPGDETARHYHCNLKDNESVPMPITDRGCCCPAGRGAGRS